MAALLVFVLVAFAADGGRSGLWPALAAFSATFAFVIAGKNKRRAWGRGFLVDGILAVPLPLTMVFPRAELLDGDDDIVVAKGVAALIAITASTLIGGICLIASHRSFHGR
ncbi:MAG: hypothetical protein JSS04_06500 [Proteobacteria bacterium]|nr:hypothetical protein [Pseudomonadota bacterium]